MKRTSQPLWLGALLALAVLYPASAAPFTWVSDPTGDHTGNLSYSIVGLGWRFEAGNLEVRIRTNFPEAGLSGGTTYTGNDSIQPGDLYLNVGGTRVGGGGTVYGLGMTTHSGVKQSDPKEAGYPWKPVVKGNLYRLATFATGTYEGYPNAGLSGTPYDGGNDPFGTANNYPTLIANYATNLGAVGSVNWGPVVTPNPTPAQWKYEIAASIPVASLQSWNQKVDIWWAMECGNDAIRAQTTNTPVPEPGTLALVGLGLAGIAARRRRHA